MAFGDSLFPPRFSGEARGSFTSSLKKRKNKNIQGFFRLRACSESPGAVSQPSGVQGKVRQGRGEAAGRGRQGSGG